MADLTVINVKRKILWESEFDQTPFPQTPDVVIAPIITMKIDEGLLHVQTKRIYKQRVGNGHKSTKVRNLFDYEKDSMRHELFLPKNGQISKDDCVVFKPSLASVISIFQITGFISLLHAEVAEGRTQVNNLVAYESWMRFKYNETLWARYNHPRYVEVRKLNQDLINKGQMPTHKVSKDQSINVSLTSKP